MPSSALIPDGVIRFEFHRRHRRKPGADPVHVSSRSTATRRSSSVWDVTASTGRDQLADAVHQGRRRRRVRSVLKSDVPKRWGLPSDHDCAAGDHRQSTAACSLHGTRAASPALDDRILPRGDALTPRRCRPRSCGRQRRHHAAVDRRHAQRTRAFVFVERTMMGTTGALMHDEFSKGFAHLSGKPVEHPDRDDREAEHPLRVEQYPRDGAGYGRSGKVSGAACRWCASSVAGRRGRADSSLRQTPGGFLRSQWWQCGDEFVEHH